MKRKHDVRSRWHTSVRLVQMQLEVSQMILSSTAKELRDSQLVDNRWRNVWIDAQGKRLGVTASGKKERKTGRQTEERTNERTNEPSPPHLPRGETATGIYTQSACFCRSLLFLFLFRSFCIFITRMHICASLTRTIDGFGTKTQLLNQNRCI